MLSLFIYWSADVYLKYYSFISLLIFLLFSKGAASLSVYILFMVFFLSSILFIQNTYLYYWMSFFIYLVLLLFLIKLIFKRLFAYSSCCSFWYILYRKLATVILWIYLSKRFVKRQRWTFIRTWVLICICLSTFV